MSSIQKSPPLRQRVDYTYKFNAKTGRHGWLRLTPAYSIKLVEELIIGREKARRVLDPFCGTGTTALSAANHGHEAATIDVNPFLVWLARAKTAHYSANDINRTQNACAAVVDLVRQEAVAPAPTPPIYNIERWWGQKALVFLRLLYSAIAEVAAENIPERTLLMIGFCRCLIKLSNAAFNHQSISFKENSQLTFELEADMAEVFAEEVRFILGGASENPPGTCVVALGDSRQPAAVIEGPFDLVITSPPYANRISYIRELRPYMYWLGFLGDGRDAGELDWMAIGGTWGIATSRLMDWKRPAGHFESAQLARILDRISHADNKNGTILANYVAKYFDDMWRHFQGLPLVLSRGAEVHYIVGNSAFYGQLVPTEHFYAEMLTALGFAKVACKAIRKRNSKKELIEFDVIGKWGSD
ncbi:DNA adenine methylase [candidate division KSB1 bacterium]|nr:DNA adenine methylase [candidate division KSB1 bacterium]